MVFTTYGELVDVHLLMKPASSGAKCAFVIYKEKDCADDALAKLNGVYKIRPDAEEPIKVDWPKAPPKNEMEDLQPRLYVGNLPKDATEAELRYVFSTYGEITDMNLLVPRNQSEDKMCFICYAKKESAEDAIQALNDVYKIRADAEKCLLVKWAKPRHKGKDGGGKGDGKGWDSGSKGKGGKGWDDGWKGGKDWWQDNKWSGWSDGGWDSGSWGKGSWDRGNSWPAAKGGDWGKDGKGKGDKGKGKGKDWGKGGKGKDEGSYGEASPSQSLHVSNLPEDIVESAIEYVFKTYGTVKEVKILRNTSRGGRVAAFVDFSTVEEADTAILSLKDNYEIRPGFGPIVVKFASSHKHRSSPY